MAPLIRKENWIPCGSIMLAGNSHTWEDVSGPWLAEAILGTVYSEALEQPHTGHSCQQLGSQKPGTSCNLKYQGGALQRHSGLRPTCHNSC
jgi:hypothetical protein